MSEIQEIIQELIKFRNERDWEQFHDTKNLAVALSIEAAELNELFLWKDIAESENIDKSKLKEELADIFHTHSYLPKNMVLMSKKLYRKIRRNGKISSFKAKGTAKKYNEL